MAYSEETHVVVVGKPVEAITGWKAAPSQQPQQSSSPDPQHGQACEVASYGLLLTLLVRPSPDPVALWPDPVTPAMDPVALARLPLLAGATTVAIERRRRWWISGIRGEREVVALVDRACGCGSGADGRGGLQWLDGRPGACSDRIRASRAEPAPPPWIQRYRAKRHGRATRTRRGWAAVAAEVSEVRQRETPPATPGVQLGDRGGFGSHGSWAPPPLGEPAAVTGLAVSGRGPWLSGYGWPTPSGAMAGCSSRTATGGGQVRHAVSANPNLSDMDVPMPVKGGAVALHLLKVTTVVGAIKAVVADTDMGNCMQPLGDSQRMRGLSSGEGTGGGERLPGARKSKTML
ncbi:unnamed protein product [Miscanthus lutarioriparius]|uniref:Uncharacterized protein n=1 Tax=Miscanthus lutarioriparius TaxID=422564 RepID=A0A811NNW8_9POAL|nr:unnamed protein product [Miscanthus lutarioriparius]